MIIMGIHCATWWSPVRPIGNCYRSRGRSRRRLHQQGEDGPLGEREYGADEVIIPEHEGGLMVGRMIEKYSIV
jgi:hypothetical protein